MRADIDSSGMLHVTPTSMTEETMLNVWFSDKREASLLATILVQGFEDIGPTCIKAIAETAEDVGKLSGDLRKAERVELKKELDKLVKGEYNIRASNEVLKKTLVAARQAAIATKAAGDPSEKQPGKVTKPKPEPKEKPVSSVGPPLEALEDHKAQYKVVYEALKECGAVAGSTIAVALLAKYEATMMSQVAEASYPVLLEELKAATAEAKVAKNG